MRCSHCGAEIANGSKFCIKCGTKVVFAFTKELIDSAMAGNQAAIAELYNQTYNSVYQAVKLVIKNDEDSVLDIVQDTYIRGFRYLQQLDKPENFRAWIKRIGVNTAKNYLKKKKPILFSELNPEEDEEAPLLQFEDDRVENLPEVQMDQQETARLIREILDSLSDEQRIAMTMFYFNELSVREIAEELECSENTIKSRLNYGRQKVKAKVEELAKRGTKLYSLAPLPFLVCLLRTQEAQAAMLPDLKMLHGIQKSLAAVMNAGNKAVGTGIQNTAKAAVKNAVKDGIKVGAKAGANVGIKAAGKAVTGKIVAGIAAAAVAVTAAVAVPVIVSSTKKAPVAIEAPVPDQLLSGEELAEQRREEELREEERQREEDRLQQEAMENEEAEEGAAADGDNGHAIYADELEDFLYRYENQIGFSDGRGNAYGYFDLNEDGQDEFLIVEMVTDEDGEPWVYTVNRMYTVIDGEVVQVVDGWSRNSYTIYEHGYIFNKGAIGDAASEERVYFLSTQGTLEEVSVSPDSLQNRQSIEYTILPPVEEEASANSAKEDSVSKSGGSGNEMAMGSMSATFEELLDRIHAVIMLGVDGSYDVRPDQIEEAYADLGEGIVWILTHREQGVYTLDFYYLLYDIDGDGEEELLLGRGVSPSFDHVSLFAIYEPDGEPIVGDAIFNYSIPEDAAIENPWWNYIDAENY